MPFSEELQVLESAEQMEGISLLLCTSVNGLINTPSPILDLSELIYPSNVLFMINTQIKPKIVEARRGS